MKNPEKLPFLAFAVLLAGCSQQPAAAPESRPVAEECLPVEAEPATVSGIQALPPDVVLALPVRLRAISFATTKVGSTRARTVYEVVGGDAAAALGSAKQSMEAGGFKAGATKSATDGRAATQAFRRNNYGTVKVTARSGSGAKPSSQDVTALLILDFPVQNHAGLERAL